MDKFYIRNAHNQDFQAIHRLLSLKSSKFVGQTKRKAFEPDVFFEIYYTHIIVVKEKVDDENIIGYAEIKNHPNIPALPIDSWMDWLNHHYCVNLPISLSNVLFVNFFIYDMQFCPDLVLSFLSEIFFREYCVRYIISVEPPYRALKFKEDEPDFTIFEKFSKIYYPKDFSVTVSKNTQKIYIMSRDDIIPTMRFRRALPEDNDEIVEIIDEDRPMIKKELGDYYIAEELLSNSPHKTLIVTEVNNQSVGFIWLNININIIRLIKNFELETYDNLLKFSPDEYWKIMTHDYRDLVRKPKENLFTKSAIIKLYNELEKTPGPFALKGETSSLSIFSHFSLPVLVHSASSSATTIEEECEFMRRERVFSKFRLLEDRLKSSKWYIEQVERTFRTKYNSYFGISGEILRSNAFALQLYGLHSSNDFRKLHQFLVAAFSSHPDRDYCVFSVPLQWHYTKCLRELLHYFERVMPRADSQIEDKLYITHRACILGDISVYKVQQEDIQQLRALLSYQGGDQNWFTKSASEFSRQYQKGRSRAKNRTSMESQASNQLMKAATAKKHTGIEYVSKQTISAEVSKQHIKNESSRVSKQPVTASGFSQRKSNESSRLSKQPVRTSALKQRINNESTRASKQPVSANASKQRISYETSRFSKPTISASSSKQRISTDPSRASKQRINSSVSKQRMSSERKSSGSRTRLSSLKPRLSKHSRISKFTTEFEPVTIEDEEEEKDEPKMTTSEIEVEILDQISKEILANELSDYQILKICIGDSTKPVKDNTIVGFVIIRAFQQVHLLHKHYIIPECDEARNFCRCEIIMLKLHPLFRFDSDRIFREIARITGFWDFYFIQPIKSNFLPLSNDLIAKMQPVEPRRQKKKFYREADVVAFQGRMSIATLIPLHLSNDYFAIYQQNMRPTKYFGSKDTIVIIGFNSFTKAFLRLHIFYFNYSSDVNTNMYCCVPRLNITVIAPPGVIEAEQEYFFECETCQKQTDCYVNSLNHNSFIRDVSHRMDMSKYVKFVNANVQSIDRKKQKVYLNDHCGIYYDRLLIFESLIFGPPKHIPLNERPPPNYQEINNRFDKIIVYHKLRTLIEDLQNISPNIIVYGAHLHAFEFINFLLEHGIKGESISLVMPKYTFVDTELHLNNPYCDQSIEKILLEMAEDLHVNVYDNVKFSHWTCYPSDENIETMSFIKYDADEFETVMVTLNCDLLVSFLEAKTYLRMVDVFKEAKLKMHKELIVTDEYYRTNDPRILAFGRNTKINVEVNHQTRYANPKEVAEKLMKIITAPLDQKHLNLDEKFRQPNLCKVRLPFNYRMIKIISPKLYLENHLSNEYVQSLTTYEDNDFTRVRLNQHGFVEEIVVVTQKTMDLEFLDFFCGKHEKLLNNLLINWTLKRFDNFLDFFQEPWTELIMHDHFSELREINRELIIDTINDILTYKKDYDRAHRRSVARHRLADMSVPSDMEEHFFAFLRKYRKDFYFSFALPEDFAQ